LEKIALLQRERSSARAVTFSNGMVAHELLVAVDA